jgi:hypothetical protein
MIIKSDNSGLDERVVHWLDNIHQRTKADIFLVDPEERNEDGSPQIASKEQLRLMIFGDMLTKENAKIHALVMIDQMVFQSPIAFWYPLTLSAAKSRCSNYATGTWSSLTHLRSIP